MDLTLPIRRLLHPWVHALQEALFPAKCLACGAIFQLAPGTGGRAANPAAEGTHGPGPWQPATFNEVMAPFFCRDCIRGFRPVGSPLCPVCGTVYPGRDQADHWCEDCIRSPRRFNMARASGIYDRSLRTAVHLLKYRGKIQLAGPLGRLLFASFIRFWAPDRIDLLVPVPLHRRRLRQRGFNQAWLLIREWERLLAGMGNGQPRIRTAPRALVRHRRTPPQTGLDKNGRRENMKHAFCLSGEVPVADRRILLVDDVFTTGATAAECARVLHDDGGARTVDVLTLARAQ